MLWDYLSNRQQGTKVDSFFNSWEYILSGEPHESILDSLLLNISVCNMFLILKAVYFTTYTDDDSLFAGTDNIKDVIQSLQEVSESLITWFSENQMNLNPDKCHQLLNTKEQTTLKIYT